MKSWRDSALHRELGERDDQSGKQTSRLNGEHTATPIPAHARVAPPRASVCKPVTPQHMHMGFSRRGSDSVGDYGRRELVCADPPGSQLSSPHCAGVGFICQPAVVRPAAHKDEELRVVVEGLADLCAQHKIPAQIPSLPYNSFGSQEVLPALKASTLQGITAAEALVRGLMERVKMLREPATL